MRRTVLIALSALSACTGESTSPYSGQESRTIAALSDDDVAALLDGKGWGFAKPAELNGFPGPRHVLDLADELALSKDQRRETETVFAEMQSRARKTGAQFVAAETALNTGFRDGAMDLADLHRLTADAAALRGALRTVHLEAHLAMMPILSEEQRQRYVMMRGYGSNNHTHKH